MRDSDQMYHESRLTTVEPGGAGWWTVTSDDGWSIGVPVVASVTPAPGMTLRCYGKPFGPVRGMLLDGREVYYRTEQEDKEYREIEMYGRDAADVVARWDRGDTVWSVEMGGLGPGYEQCIQITMIEVLRHMLAAGYDASTWTDSGLWRADEQRISDSLMETVSPLGLSGAQWGAAVSLAVRFYRDGPRHAVMAVGSDRQIQVSKAFPSLARAVTSDVAE